jgi:uncharacterized membrane protein YgcG
MTGVATALIKLRRTSAALIALGLWVFGGSAFAAEVIQTFDSEVRLAKDGDLNVTETLHVQAEGRDIRHGIYRDFPLTFKDAGGVVREVDFKLLGVERDGKAETYSTTRNHGILRIYAGDKDTNVSRGPHTYVFRYRTGRQVRRFDGKPELNWNVTGNFWNFPILAATYRLQFAAGGAPVRWTAFTGRVGARGTDWRGSLGALGTLTVETTRPLSPGEGLTVVAEIPASAVDPPDANKLLWYQIFDNRQWIFGGIGLALVLAYYLAAWLAVGRDPGGGTIIPLFYPPKGISPALANYIHKWGLGREKWRAFTAAALSLAVKGLLKLNSGGNSLTLKTTGQDPQGRVPLSPEESAIITKLNASGGSLVIDSSHGTTVEDLGKKFTTAVELGNRNRFFRRNLGYFAAGLALTAAAVVGVLTFGGLQDQDIGILSAFGFGGFFLSIIAMQTLPVFFSGFTLASVFRGLVSLAFFAVFISISTSIIPVVFPNGFGSALPVAWSFIENYPFPFVLVTAFTTVNGVFFHLLRAPTMLGRPIMDQLDGFRLYLETAEADRLNMSAPEITTDRFESLLPYAVALDVEKPWSDAFAAALRRAHPDDPDPMNHYQPGWSSGGGWSGSNLGNAVSSSVASVSGALASAMPVSSGSSGFSGGGGGGSGGGGGGGGGGGW